MSLPFLRDGTLILAAKARHELSLPIEIREHGFKQKGAVMKNLLLVLIAAFTLTVGTVYAEDSLAQALISYYGEDRDTWHEFFIEHADSHSESDSAWYYLGRVQFEEDMYKEAAKSFEKAVEYNEQSSLFHLWLGRAFGIRAQQANLLLKGRYGNKFKDHIDLAIEYDPDNLSAREDRLQFYLQAPGFMGGGTDKAYAEAESIYVRDLSRGVNARVQVLVDDKKLDLAAEEIRGLIQSMPEDSAAVLQLVFFHQEQEDWDSAYSVLDSLLLERPEFAGALYQVGRTAAFSGQRLDDGISALQRYIEIGPSSEDVPQPTYAWYRLGMLYEEKENTDAALQAYRTAVELDSTNEWASDALNEMNK
jgi:tetratricopeptide (TPR) repeat protein